MDTTQTFRILGMHCAACTKLTAKWIKTLPGVRDVTVDLDTSRATVVADRPLGLDEVQSALRGSDYIAERDDD